MTNASPPRPAVPGGARLPRAHRLTDKPQFDRVHRGGLRVADGLFTVTVQPNAAGHARLGMAIGLRATRTAVNRNRVKRLIRESFRAQQQELPPVDLVVNAKPATGPATNAELRASLAALWVRIRERCARS